jgi:thiosulfate reductase cytochrome b subunit
LGSLDFPLWLRINHFVNFLFLTMLIRSGIHILTAKPKLYLNENCSRDTEWLDLSRFSLTTGDSSRLAKVASHVALPGGLPEKGLEAARGLHFLSVIFWCLNGLIYTSLLFATGEWKRLIPTSGSFFPCLLNELNALFCFHLPAHSETYGAIQQLFYVSLIFAVAPLSILTGAAMSVAVDAKYPWYPRLFGGRQAARSIHYLLLLVYIVFVVVHVSIVAVTGFAEQMNRITLGSQGDGSAGIIVGAIAISVVSVIHAGLNWWSRIDLDRVEKITAFLPSSLGAIALGRFGSTENTDIKSLPADKLSEEQLRELIRVMLVEQDLKTQMEPFPETRKQFDAIVDQLHDLEGNVLEQKLVISGFAARPINEQECSQCMYYLSHRKWCDLPELSLPVEPEWWCRLWRI